MVKEEEIRACFLRLLENLWQGCQGYEYPVYLSLRIPNLKPWIIPVFGQGCRGYPFYGLGYLMCERHR